MAININLTIPDERQDEVLTAFGAGYGPGGTKMTEAQFLQQLKDYINNTVVAMYEAQELDRVRAERAIEVSSRRVQEMNIQRVID